MLTLCTQKYFAFSTLWLYSVIIAYYSNPILKVELMDINGRHFCLTCHSSVWVLDKVNLISQPCKTRSVWLLWFGPNWPLGYQQVLPLYLSFKYMNEAPMIYHGSSCPVSWCFRVLVFTYNIESSNYRSYCLCLCWEILSISACGPHGLRK